MFVYGTWHSQQLFFPTDSTVKHKAKQNHIVPKTKRYATAGCLLDVTLLVSALTLRLPYRVASMQRRLAVGASRTSECFSAGSKHSQAQITSYITFINHQIENAIKRYTVDDNNNRKEAKAANQTGTTEPVVGQARRRRGCRRVLAGRGRVGRTAGVVFVIRRPAFTKGGV